MYSEWPFFRVLVENIQMALAKADLDIAKDYAELVENKVAAKEIINDIAEEYDSTVTMLLSIVESQALLSENKKLSISLDRRKPYLDTLNYIQVMLIKKHRNLSEKNEDIFDMLLRTINSIAIGMRNTG